MFGLKILFEFVTNLFTEEMAETEFFGVADEDAVENVIAEDGAESLGKIDSKDSGVFIEMRID